MNTQRSDNGRDLAAMLSQPDSLLERTAAIRSELESTEVSGTADGVTVVFNGAGEPRRVHIDPSRIDTTNVELLERRVLEALRAGREPVTQAAQQLLGPLTAALEDLR